MTARLTLPLLAFATLAAPTLAQTAIGQWRDHLPYAKTRTVIEGGGAAYCATRNAIFSFDPATDEITRFNKTNALSDIDITAMAWNAPMGALLVGYGNGNLDVIRGETTTNLSDIKRSTLIGDKRIYGITCDGPIAYLCCGFGIVVMDLERREVKDTWIIFPGAEYHRVNALAFHGDSIYAATEIGLFSGSQQETNLAAFGNWYRRNDLPQPGGYYSMVLSFQDKLVTNWSTAPPSNAETDTLYYFDNGWQRLSDAYGYDNKAISLSSDGQRMAIAQTYGARQYNGAWERIFQTSDPNAPFMFVNGAAAAASGGLWVATDNIGLRLFTAPDQSTPISPNGPRNTGAYRIVADEGLVMAVSGSPSGNWSNSFSHEGVHVFKEGTWRSIQEADDVGMQGVNGYGGGAVDPLAVVIDPADPSHAYTGSWEEGVLEWRDQVVQTIWNTSNSSLSASGDGSQGIVYVGGLAYDRDGNLWVSNANTDDCISVRKKDGTWKAFNTGGLLGSNYLISDVLPASNGLKWFVRPRGYGILVFSDGGTIDDTGDDQYKLLTTFENQGKLPTLEVGCIAEDQDNEIWVGTAKGIAVFYNPDAIFSGENFDCQQILIEQDGNIQILLETETVTDIEVDGGDRKWIGTQTSGAFLVSPDGTSQIAHFTAENSPLPSNNILSIAIDGGTGEVFFGTDQGIVGYRGDATEGAVEATCATVFPNPVRESYQGPVAITGLVADSDVRITDVAGNLVYRTVSKGGQAMWPGTDLGGARVATGVYLVMASDPTGTETCNTRVLVVR